MVDWPGWTSLSSFSLDVRRFLIGTLKIIPNTPFLFYKQVTTWIFSSSLIFSTTAILFTRKAAPRWAEMSFLSDFREMILSEWMWRSEEAKTVMEMHFFFFFGVRWKDNEPSHIDGPIYFEENRIYQLQGLRPWEHIYNPESQNQMWLDATGLKGSGFDVT